MSVKIGINPITWSNDDVPELGGDTPLETCLSETRQAGYRGNLGVPMIRDAFAPGKGPLTEKGLARGEQESEMHLFAGAIGLFKNPHSHRSGVSHEPAEAVELILFASHLLRRLDRAKARRGQTLP